MLAKFNFYYDTLNRSQALLSSSFKRLNRPRPASQSARESVLARLHTAAEQDTLHRLRVPFAEQLLRLQVTERTRTAFTSRMP